MQVLAYLELKPLRLAVRHFLEEKNKTNKNQTIFRFPNAIRFGFWFENPVNSPDYFESISYIHRHVYMQSEKYCSRMLSVPFFFKRPLVHHQLSGGKNKEKIKGRRLLLDGFLWTCHLCRLKWIQQGKPFTQSKCISIYTIIVFFLPLPSTKS